MKVLFVYTTDLKVTLLKVIFNINFSGPYFRRIWKILFLFHFQFHHFFNVFFLILFLAKSLFDLKGKSDGFHFLFLDSSPFLSLESFTEMLDLTARPVERYTVFDTSDNRSVILWKADLSCHISVVYPRLSKLASSSAEIWCAEFSSELLFLKKNDLCCLLWYLHPVRFIHFSMQVGILIIATTTTAIQVWNRSLGWKSLLVLLYIPPSSSRMPQAMAEMSQEFCLF